MKYVIITPAHNEEDFIEITIKSIIKQTILPQEWIIVDDNSTDQTASIIKNYAAKYEWIEYIYHHSGPWKSQGAKVIEAFNFGLAKLGVSDYDFISKIDADLELPSDYFEKIGNSLYNNPKIGVLGGQILEFKNNSWKKIPQASYHIRGALKSYRKECFINIDGLMPVLGWDGLDEMKAMYYGWQTKIIDSSVKHFRPASSDYVATELLFNLGIANYKNGGGLFLALIRGIVRMKRKPYILSGLYFLKGYFFALIKKEPKNVDKALARFINRFHMKRLFSFVNIKF